MKIRTVLTVIGAATVANATAVAGLKFNSSIGGITGLRMLATGLLAECMTPLPLYLELSEMGYLQSIQRVGHQA